MNLRFLLAASQLPSHQLAARPLLEQAPTPCMSRYLAYWTEIATCEHFLVVCKDCCRTV